jgi:hypothetical protein
LIYRSDRFTNPVGALSAELAVRHGALPPTAKAALEARFAVRNAAIAERVELQQQLQDVERQIRNVNPLPAAHPARALEAGLLEQAAALRVAIDAVAIPPHPNEAEIAAAMREMWR